MDGRLVQNDIAQRPYLYRAMHEWMTDSGQTPHIVVDATVAGTSVPRDSVQDGRIVLNVSYAATHGLDMSNDGITFQARFGGRPFAVSVPASAVLAIYARETGEGMVFSEPTPTGEQPAASEAAMVIMDSEGRDSEALDSAEPPPDQAPETTGDADKPSRHGDRSHLRVVK